VDVTKAKANEILLTYQLKKSLGALKEDPQEQDQRWVRAIETIISTALNEHSGREGRTVSHVREDANLREKSAKGYSKILLVEVADGEIVDLRCLPNAALTQDHSGEEQ
jgi:hypothetical protein